MILPIMRLHHFVLTPGCRRFIWAQTQLSWLLTMRSGNGDSAGLLLGSLQGWRGQVACLAQSVRCKCSAAQHAWHWSGFSRPTLVSHSLGHNASAVLEEEQLTLSI